MENNAVPLKAGVEEVKSVTIAANELMILLLSRFKDGAQLGDFLFIFDKVVMDPEFKKIMADAYTNYEKIPDELQDIDMAEMLALASIQMSYLPRILGALKR